MCLVAIYESIDSHMIQCSPQSELKAYGEYILWVELVTTSKPLGPPQSHIKVKQVVKGRGPLPLKYAGENICDLALLKLCACYEHTDARP